MDPAPAHLMHVESVISTFELHRSKSADMGYSPVKPTWICKRYTRRTLPAQDISPWSRTSHDRQGSPSGHPEMCQSKHRYDQCSAHARSRSYSHAGDRSHVTAIQHNPQCTVLSPILIRRQVLPGFHLSTLPALLIMALLRSTYPPLNVEVTSVALVKTHPLSINLNFLPQPTWLQARTSTKLPSWYWNDSWRLKVPG